MTSKQQNSLMALLLVLYGLLVDHYIGFDALNNALAQVGVFKFSALMLSLIATQWVRTWRLKEALSYQKIGRIAPFSVCYRITQMHNVINTILPFRVGELSMPLLLRNGFKLPLSTGMGLLLWFRLLDVLTLLALGAWCYLILSGRWIGLLILSLAITMLPRLLYAAADVYAHRPKHIASIIDNQTWERLMVGAAVDLEMQYRFWGLSLVNWGVKILSLGVLVQLIVDASLLVSVASALGGELSSILPIHAPGGIGTYAGGVAASGIILGIDFELALQTGVILHFAVIFSALISLGLSQLLYLWLAGGNVRH